MNEPGHGAGLKSSVNSNKTRRELDCCSRSQKGMQSGDHDSEEHKRLGKRFVSHGGCHGDIVC